MKIHLTKTGRGCLIVCILLVLVLVLVLGIGGYIFLYKDCPDCGGDGKKNILLMVLDCKKCNGTGKIRPWE